MGFRKIEAPRAPPLIHGTIRGLRESTIKEQRGIFPEAMPYNSLALRNWEFKV